MPYYEFPHEGSTTVADDVAVDLWEPEGEVEEGHDVRVDGAEGEWPGDGAEGDEEDERESKDELSVDGCEVGETSGSLWRGCGCSCSCGCSCGWSC